MSNKDGSYVRLGYQGLSVAFLLSIVVAIYFIVNCNLQRLLQMPIIT